MKAYHQSKNFITPVIVCLFTAFMTMGFTDSASESSGVHTKIDTVPSKQSIDIHIDMSDLNKALQQVNRELKNIEWDKISEDVRSSIRKIDMEKISNDVANSLDNIDWGKIQNDIDRSLRNIDLGNIDVEIHNAERNNRLNMSKKELKKMHELKLEEARKELKRAQQELRRAKKELEQNRKYKDVKSEEVKAPSNKNKKLYSGETNSAFAFPLFDRLKFFHLI